MEIPELIGALGKIENYLRDSATQLADKTAIVAKGTDEETLLLHISSEMNDCSEKIFCVIESLRDYNSRHNLPIRS
jgi:hypothetical protein